MLKRMEEKKALEAKKKLTAAHEKVQITPEPVTLNAEGSSA